MNILLTVLELLLASFCVATLFDVIHYIIDKTNLPYLVFPLYKGLIKTVDGKKKDKEKKADETSAEQSEQKPEETQKAE